MRIISFFFVFWALLSSKVMAQDSLQFLAYGNIPIWVAVATDWQTKPVIHLYDSKIYKGHADFINRGLGRKIMFPEFKRLCMSHEKRQYLPFFVYDLRSKPISLDTQDKNSKYEWAIRIEDYEYDDSPEELAQNIRKLHDLLRQKMPFLNTNGLIVLSNGGTNNFNIIKLAQPLKQKGLNYCTLQTIMNHFKSANIQILNEMPAWGRLLKIKNEKDLLNATMNDIVVMDFIPQKLPPVAGIITIVPQTPLSHVNLLAKNRGTLNVYAIHFTEMQLYKYWDKWVHISFSPTKKILFEEINEADARLENEKRKPKPLSIPTPNTDSPYLISLNGQYAKTYGSAEYMGAKAANYAFLLSFLDKKYIRPAYALSFALYESVILNSTNVNSLMLNLLRQKDSLSAEAIQAKLKEIRKTIKAGHIDEKLLFQLTINLYKTYPNTKIRLRSSTNCEDLPNFNGAGLYLSEGFNTNEADSVLVKKILKVYASLWTWEAFQEREYYGIDHSKAAMAILIHEAFPDEAANGVILTQPQLDGRISILINVQSGDNPIVSPENEAICESFLVDIKQGKVGQIFSRSSISPVFVENKQYESLLPILTEQVKHIHEKFIERQKMMGDTHNYGVDIEFKITQKGEFYVKQARLLAEVLPE